MTGYIRYTVAFALLAASGTPVYTDSPAGGAPYAASVLSGSFPKKEVDFTAVSPAGDVIGDCHTDGGLGSPTEWPAGSGDPAFLDQADGVASAVNPAGVIVGRVGCNAVAWRNGVEKVLSMPSSVSYAAALGVNGNGEIVGQAVRDGKQSAFLRLSNAAVVFLPSLAGFPESSARTINDSGVIAGACFRDDGASRACVWRDRKPLGLPPPGVPSTVQPGSVDVAANAEAQCMNERGDIAGICEVAPGQSHACLWRDGKAIDLGALPGDSASRAVDMNSDDVVVGVSGFKNAFVWKDGAMTALRDVISPPPPWTPSQATAINDKGQIAGWGVDDNGHITGFLLTPQPAATAP
ncbi:MAG: hypothetical protein ACLQVD_05660 [Capsulimonadaceae bacterium]